MFLKCVKCIFGVFGCISALIFPDLAPLRWHVSNLRFETCHPRQGGDNFARNTVDLLETVRHLKELGIEVQFEKEHISSLSDDGELMLSLLASFAQEEVRSLSDNAQKRMQQGIPNGHL